MSDHNDYDPIPSEKVWPPPIPPPLLPSTRGETTSHKLGRFSLLLAATSLIATGTGVIVAEWAYKNKHLGFVDLNEWIGICGWVCLLAQFIAFVLGFLGWASHPGKAGAVISAAIVIFIVLWAFSTSFTAS